MNNINKYISQEKVYYRIPDQYLQQIKNNNIPIIIDHNHYYCIISMYDLYMLFPHNQNIRVKYYCEKCGKSCVTDCQSITRKAKKSDGHLFCPKCMKCYSLYKYSTNGVPTSKQQVYFASLFKNAILNYPVNKLFIDIAFPEQKIGIEYNGSGHDLSAKLNHLSHKQFIRKEWSRRMILRKNGWKIIYIINPKDYKINLYTDDEYKKIFTYINKYLLEDDIIELYIIDNRIITHTKIIYINDILTNNSLNVKNMPIFSIKQAVKYLHISTKTFYKANILVNITPYNFRYYTQEQLDEYINAHGKIGSNYFLIEEAADYLHTSVNKVKLLQDVKQLYPYVINDEHYFHVKQLDHCIQSHILDNYFSTDDAVKYLAKHNINKVTHTLRNDNHLPATYIINQQKFYTKEQLDAYIEQYQYINSLYTRKQAAEYLHISSATLDRKKESGELVPVEKGYLYTKSQLDDYLAKNELTDVITDDDYVLISQAMEAYHVTDKQVRNWITTGQLKAKIFSTKYYIKKDDIEQHLQSLQVVSGYLSRGDILAKYDITKRQLRTAMENKKVRVIKQRSKLFYNSDDVVEYIKFHSGKTSNQYFNIEKSLKYLGVNLKALRNLQKMGIVLPDYEDDHRKYYSLDSLNKFNKNKDKILMNIQDALTLIKNSRCSRLIDSCRRLDSVVIKRFTYIKCADFIELVKDDMSLFEVDCQFYIENGIRPIYYQHKYYVFEYQQAQLKKKLMRELVTIIGVYYQRKTDDELQNYDNLYTTASAA